MFGFSKGMKYMKKDTRRKEMGKISESYKSKTYAQWRFLSCLSFHLYVIHLLSSVGGAIPIHRQLLLAFANGLGQILEHNFGILPADAGVSDTDPIFQPGLALRRNLLVACKREKCQPNILLTV
jgi:hypothetical protein